MRGTLQKKVVVQVAAGDEHPSCVTRDGSVYVWGNNDQGQLGVRNVIDAELPMLVQALIDIVNAFV